MSEARYSGMQRCLAGTANCMQMFFKCMASAMRQNGDQLVTLGLFCIYDFGHATCIINTAVPSVQVYWPLQWLTELTNPSNVYVDDNSSTNSAFDTHSSI